MFETVTSEAQKLLKKMGGEAENVAWKWEKPDDVNHGDITTTVALQLARMLKKSPRDVAEELASKVTKIAGVERCEVAGAGYINVWLTPKALLEELAVTRKACTPAVTRKKEAPVIVEYCSLNIAKPLGVHHILTTMIGQVIANLYAHAGTPVVRWNYLGDWGTQFGKLFVAFEKWGKGADPEKISLNELLALYVKFHEEAEKDPELEVLGQAAFRRLEDGDKEVRRVWQAFVDVTKRAVAPVLERLSARFDTDLGESHYDSAMGPIIEEGKKKAVFTSGEKGALIVEFPPPSLLPPAVVLKSDGGTNYLTRDLALVVDRIARYHPSAILHVVGVEQTLHFQQLMATAKLLGWELPVWEHIIFGRMRFADQSMSTRKGTILHLEEVLDEAVRRADAIIKERGDAIQSDDPKELGEMMGIGAVVYGILSQNRKMDIVFDWDKMLSFEGNSAPYLQYTHARARSVIRKAGADSNKTSPAVKSLTVHERQLLGKLLQFSSVLDHARTEHLPHVLANYLHQLCQDFNTFYNVDPILTAPEAERAFRLLLTDSAATVLKTGAEILTLRVPERM